MNQNTTTVSTMARHIAALDTDAELDLSAEFTFDPSDALAVTMTVSSVDGPVVWTFARELLIDGQYQPTGDGDVHVWPCLSASGDAVVIVELDSPTGETMLQFPSRDVQEFVAASLATVPLGAEEIDVDAWLEQLLTEA